MRSRVWVLALCMVAGCGKAPRTLHVMAAASLTESFTEIGRKFEAQHPGVSVRFEFAGSQELRRQLEESAPADVFASANVVEMETAKGEKLVVADTIRVFAENRLVMVYPQDNPAKLSRLEDLARPGVKIDLADASVPAGKYALQMLDRLAGSPRFGADFKKNVLANVVSREQNVEAVVNKVRLGEVDAGVVYVSDVTRKSGGDLGVLPIPDAMNPIARYPIAVASAAAWPDLAREFEDKVTGPEGRETLQRHGFSIDKN